MFHFSLKRLRPKRLKANTLLKYFADKSETFKYENYQGCLRYNFVSFRYLKTSNYIISPVMENKSQLSNAIPIHGEVIWRLSCLNFLVVFHVSFTSGLCYHTQHKFNNYSVTVIQKLIPCSKEMLLVLKKYALAKLNAT